MSGYRVVCARALAVAVLLQCRSVLAAPDVTIQDMAPAPDNWSGVILHTESNHPDFSGSYVDTGSPSSGGAPPSGGPYLNARFANGPKSCAQGTQNCFCDQTNGCWTYGNSWYDALYEAQTYTPADQGAVSSIDVSVQLKALDPPDANDPDPETNHPTSFQIFFAARQNGITYWKAGVLADWFGTSCCGSGEANWHAASDAFDVDNSTFKYWADLSDASPTVGSPDFVSGGPITFGLLVVMTTASQPLTITFPLGIDDFSVTIHRPDIDGDGINDEDDNCVKVANAAPFDCDTDQDGYGNMCDGDFDNDYFVLPSDYNVLAGDLGTSYDTSGTGTDMDCDGYVFPSDYTHWLGQAQTVAKPGPSGLSCAGTIPCD